MVLDFLTKTDDRIIKLKGRIYKAFENFTGLKTDTNNIINEIKSVKKADENVYRKPEKLFEVLNNNRKLVEDHERFIKSLKQDKETSMKAFDQLRKKYPVRRESLYI